jgi:dolichol-phosphate mannosyltransferase
MEPAFSIIIPFYNEEESVVAVLEEVRRCQPEAEVIAVDDGSSDATWEKIKSVPGVRGLKPSANRGQSAAMYYGLLRARGAVVGLMDGDGQNDPADFAKLRAAMSDGVDVVVGYRAKRKDTFSRRAASKIANRIRRMFLDDGVRDTGCSLKIFRREAVQYLVPFNGLHRYLPAIFKKAGLTVAEVPVNHRPRAQGISKYTNWDRALRGIYDLIGVGWLLKRKVHYPSIEEHNA